MNDLEDDLTSLFARIGRATPIHPDLHRAVVPTSHNAPLASRRRAPLGIAMVCFGAVVVGWVAVAVRSGNSLENQAPAVETPAVEPTALLPAPDTLATVPTTIGVLRDQSVDGQPVIDTVRLFPVYEAVGSSRAGEYLRGDMATPVGVEGLVGRRSNETLVDLVSIRVMRSRFGPAPIEPTPIQLGDRTGVLVRRSAQAATVILDGDPVIEVTARDPMGFLSAGGLDAIITTNEPSLGGWLKYTATLGPLPAGFELVVPLTPTPQDASMPAVSLGLGPADQVVVRTSRSNPLAQPAWAASVTSMAVGSKPAATGSLLDGGSYLSWEVEPGVYASVAGTWPSSLVELANDLEFVGQAEWEARYPLAQEFSGAPSVFVPIDVPGGTVGLAGCAGARVVSGQIVDGPIFDDPTRALDEFLSSPAAETLVRTGYESVVTSDDAITYGTKVDDRFVTLIIVDEVPGGWQATDWWASAC